MRDQDLVNALREHAEWAEGNQWETPITLGDDLTEAADQLENQNAHIAALQQEIEKLREQLRHLCRNYDLARLEELAEADKDGRVVVLPCKDWLEVVFGDQVLFWGIDKDYEEQPIREISLDDADRIGWYDGYKTVFLKGTDENGEAWEFYPEEIGKTVFLTREEAEKALEAMKDGY